MRIRLVGFSFSQPNQYMLFIYKIFNVLIHILSINYQMK